MTDQIKLLCPLGQTCEDEKEGTACKFYQPFIFVDEKGERTKFQRCAILQNNELLIELIQNINTISKFLSQLRTDQKR